MPAGHCDCGHHASVLGFRERKRNALHRVYRRYFVGRCFCSRRACEPTYPILVRWPQYAVCAVGFIHAGIWWGKHSRYSWLITVRIDELCSGSIRDRIWQHLQHQYGAVPDDHGWNAWQRRIAHTGGDERCDRWIVVEHGRRPAFAL